jgi:signal peptidase I
MKETHKSILTFAVSLLVLMGARTAIAEPRYIPSGSMLPTLQLQDRLVIEKVSLNFSPPQRGEILVFEPLDRPAPKGILSELAHWQGYGAYTPLIKRVVGLPGEVLEVRDGKVHINGKVLDESAHQIQAPHYQFGPIKIPAGHLFMMGDNRDNSADSHVWGPLPIENVRGRAVFRFWPPTTVGKLD